MLARPKVKTSAKFVQTSRVVSRKYYVLTNLSTRTHLGKTCSPLIRNRCTVSKRTSFTCLFVGLCRIR